MVSVIANTNINTFNNNNHKSAINPNYTVITPLPKPEQKNSNSFSSETDENAAYKSIEEYMAKVAQVTTTDV